MTDEEHFGSWPWGCDVERLTDECLIASIRFVFSGTSRRRYYELKTREVNELLHEAKRRPALVPQMVVLKLKGLIP